MLEVATYALTKTIKILIRQIYLIDTISILSEQKGL